MALQIWLPLTKDLRNQGLVNNAITSSSVVWNANGILGNQSFSGNLSIANTTQCNDFSISWWQKSSSTTTFDVKIPINNTNTNTILNFYRVDYTSSVAIKIATPGNTPQMIWIYDSRAGGENDWPLDKWNHFCITVSGANESKLQCIAYVNGKQYAQYNSTSYWFKMITGNITLSGTSSFNDFRVYNHCLTPEEVKRIAQGLVLHYPLNRNGFGEDNILVNTDFTSQYSQTSGWDTSKNGTTLANSWGGYNSGVSNPGTVYHAHLKKVDGQWVYEYIKTDAESWLGISQGSLQSKLTAGQQYTFSWEQYCVSGNNYATVGLYYYKTGASSANFHLGLHYGNSGRVIGSWQKFTYTFTAPSDADYNKNMSWYIYGTYGGNGTMYIRHPKLELGSKASNWSPAPSDTAYTTMGLNSTTEYDCSGFCNNGTRTGTFSWTSDTPKYAVSTHIGSTSSKIHISNFPTSGFGNSYSFAWWGKRSSNGPMFWGFSDGIRLNGMYAGTLWNTGDGSDNPIYKPGTTTTITAPSVNVWHHYVMIGDGTTCKLYVDGVLYGQAKTYKAISGTSIYINGWDSNTSYCSDNTDISDFRVYATALSATDVKSLYQNCATIGPDGTIYGKIR